jgi:hypothetical protein
VKTPILNYAEGISHIKDTLPSHFSCEPCQTPSSFDRLNPGQMTVCSARWRILWRLFARSWRYGVGVWPQG